MDGRARADDGTGSRSTQLDIIGTGWAFPVGDVRGLADHLTRLGADPERATALRSAARASYETRYSPSVDLARLERVYSDVVAAR